MSAVRTIRFEPSMPEADARKVIERLGGTVPEREENHMISTAGSRVAARFIAAKRSYEAIREAAKSPVTKVQP